MQAGWEDTQARVEGSSVRNEVEGGEDRSWACSAASTPIHILIPSLTSLPLPPAQPPFLSGCFSSNQSTLPHPRLIEMSLFSHLLFLPHHLRERATKLSFQGQFPFTCSLHPNTNCLPNPSFNHFLSLCLLNLFHSFRYCLENIFSLAPPFKLSSLCNTQPCTLEHTHAPGCQHMYTQMCTHMHIRYGCYLFNKA